MLIAAAKEPQFVHGKDIERLIRKQEARIPKPEDQSGHDKSFI